MVFQHIDEQELQRAGNGGGAGEKGPEGAEAGLFGKQDAAREAHHQIS